MTQDPYETLGVPRDAPQASIKRAARKRMAAAHPDHGGNPDEFVAAQRALIVLSDPMRKRAYDEKGEFNADPIDPVTAAVEGIIVPLILAGLAAWEADQDRPPGMRQGAPDPESMPGLLMHLRMCIARNIDQSEANKARMLRHAAKLEGMAKRITTRGNAANSISHFLLQRAGSVRFDAMGADKVIGMNRAALDVLATCSFDALARMVRAG